MTVVCVTRIPPPSFSDLKVLSSVMGSCEDLDRTISTNKTLNMGIDAATIVVASSAPDHMNNAPAW